MWEGAWRPRDGCWKQPERKAPGALLPPGLGLAPPHSDASYPGTVSAPRAFVRQPFLDSTFRAMRRIPSSRRVSEVA